MAKREHTIQTRDYKTWHGTGRTKPSLRTRACPICLGFLEETTAPAGQRCPSCRIWARKDYVYLGVRW